MKRKNFPARRETRRREAEVRASQRASRHDAEQIQRLDAGSHVAKRERKRLMARLRAAVNDAMGNVEAFERMLRGERGRPLRRRRRPPRV